ncbi:MAG: hypothetical protein WBH57_02555 [Anaerolineae bacterium]
MVAETVPEGCKRRRTAQMAGQSPVYAIYGEAQGDEEEGKAGVRGNHEDYEKSQRDLGERDEVRRHPQPGQEEHQGVIDSPKERPGRLTEALLQGAVGVSGEWLLDHGGVGIASPL